MAAQSFDRFHTRLAKTAGRRQVVHGLGALALGVVSAPSLVKASQDAGRPDAADEAAVRSIPRTVVEAWARGRWERRRRGVHRGCRLHRRRWSTRPGPGGPHPVLPRPVRWLAGGIARAVADVINVRFLREDVAVAHTYGGIMFPGETEVQPDWIGIQTWVAVKEDGDWLTAAYQNSRVLPEVQAARRFPD